MKRHKIKILLLLSAMTASCSGMPQKSTQDTSAPSTSQSEEAKTILSQPSSVDITYVLGHNQYRLVAQADPSTAIAETFMDKKSVEKGPIDRAKYGEFVQKVNAFAIKSASCKDASERGVANLNPCRSPFTVTVRIGKETHAASGCRSSDDGALSRLVKDGEFLLYSKK